MRACKQLGQIMDNKIQKDQKAQLMLLKSPEQKQGTAHARCTQRRLRVGKLPQPPLQPDPWTRPYRYPL